MNNEKAIEELAHKILRERMKKEGKTFYVIGWPTEAYEEAKRRLAVKAQG